MQRIQLDFIDGLRALLALYIVAHHVVQLLRVFPPALTGFLYGQAVVAMFLTLSGFCLALPQSSSGQWTVDARSFFLRRARRILPPYYAALVLAIVVNAGFQILGPFHDWIGEFSFNAVAAHILLIQNWSFRQIYTLDGPLWSIALECQIYLLFPLILLVRRRWNWYGMLAAAAAFSYTAFRLLRAHGQLYYLLFFVLGVLAADLAFRKRQRALTLVITCIAGLGCALIPHPSFLQETCASLACAGLLAYLSQEAQNPVRRVLSWKPLAWIGTFSYSIYLLHGLFLQIAWYWIRDREQDFGSIPNWRFFSFMLMVSVVAVAGSFAFHVFFERPFMSRKRQKAEQRLAAV